MARSAAELLSSLAMQAEAVMHAFILFYFILFYFYFILFYFPKSRNLNENRARPPKPQ